jgi:predicted metal-dependent TIM-barrel fold hydrolase
MEYTPMSFFIDPHIHMISRTTDDYQRMAYAQCVAVSEPAFWAGFDRGSATAFHDYFRQLTEYEPRRAAQFHIKHYCWLCINAKEAENVSLSREVIALIPEFLSRPNVLGIGEIGLNKNTANEATIFQEHLNLAMKTNELILIHTPHLEDKFKGTRMIVDMLKGDQRIKPERVCVDHVEEHTVRLALDGGPDHGQLGRRLGQVRPPGCSRVHPGNEAARAPGEHPEGGSRQPAELLAASEQLERMARGAVCEWTGDGDR